VRHRAPLATICPRFYWLRHRAHILLAAPLSARRDDLSIIGCAIARPSRRLFVAILLAAQFTPVTTIRRLYWLRHRAPLATIICRHSFGCAIYAPRDNMS
jgi:hypothetical protein